MMPRNLQRWGPLSSACFIIWTVLLAFVLFGLLLSLGPPEPTPTLPISDNPGTPVPNERPELVLKDNNVLTLAIFSDLHFGEEEHGWGIDQDVNSTRVMNTVLSTETAIDLVVLNGDLITGENTFRENSSAYVDQIVVPMVSRNIPWASTYGNHDSKYNLSREATYEAEKKYDLSYTQQMVPSLPGVTNYYLLVKNASGRYVAVLWFFDSRGGASYQKDPSNQDDIPDWVADETAVWFTQASEQIQAAHGRLPSIAFVHIPPHPFLATQKAGLDPMRFPGINEDVPVAVQGEGDSDDAFVNALLREELLHSVYVGHDHGAAWCGLWPGVDEVRRRQAQVAPRARRTPFLCFSRHTGYGGYGSWARGSRIVQLSFEHLDSDGQSDDHDAMRVETWVRMEDGAVITHISLNDTYGSDTYAPQEV